MQKKYIKIYNIEILTDNEKLELRKINNYLNNLADKRHYHNALRFACVIRDNFEDRGIISDIYYRISSIRSTLNDNNVSFQCSDASKRIYNVYLDCINNKDYVNAIRMLDCYAKCTGNSENYLKLQYAYVYSKVSQTEKAMNIIESLPIGFNDEPIYYTTLMEISYREKKYNDMIHLEKHLIKYDGCTLFDTYLKLATAYYRLGDIESFERICNMVLKMGGNNPGIIKTIDNFKTYVNDDISYPTKKDIYVSYKIALNQNNYDEAIVFHKQMMEFDKTNKYKKDNEKQLKYLISLKEGK